jgi:tetratricopeptide (TPR) repeat protein
MVKIKNCFLFLLLFCFCHVKVLAQKPNKAIDSILLVIKTAKEDTNKVISLTVLIWRLRNISDYERAKQYADSALLLADKLNFKQGKAAAYNTLGVINMDKANYPDALKYYFASLKINEEMGNRKGAGNCYNNIGIIHMSQDNYPEALKYHNMSLKIKEEYKDKDGVAASYNNIGSIYKAQGNYPEALKNQLACLKLAEETGNKGYAAVAYQDISDIYEMQGNYPQALKNLLDALKTQLELGDKRSVASLYNSIGNIYYKQDNYPDAIKNHLAALAIAKEIGIKRDIAIAYGRLGNIYHKQDNYPEAMEKYRLALKLFEEFSDKYWIARICIAMGNLLSKQATGKTTLEGSEKYTEALWYLNRGLKLAREMRANENVKDALGGLVETYKGMSDFEKALEYQNLYVEVKDSLMNNVTTQKLELQRTQYEVEKSVEEEKIKSEATLAEQKAELKRKNELLLAGFTILAIISFLIVLLIRQRNQKRRAIEKAETGHKMAELELQSLRAQLNPHFMFNSLNAIQDLILKEDNDRSHLYLSRFSKLLRMLLDNANQPFVSVKQEIEFLELYLSLENLRIPDLQFSIEKDPKINTEERMVPNMMLQPYIENAIWHGLSHKKESRKLQIRIHEEENATAFEIEDNGVGRQKAAELKSLYRKGHTSKGMELLSKRFNLLSKEYGAAIQTTITDLVNNGEAIGTLVKICVPFLLSEQAKQLIHDTNHHN